MSGTNVFSYTKRDYEGSRKEGLSKLPSMSNGVWTDLNASDPGIIILDYVHALVDMINFYQDHQALETFINTAKERANIFRLAKQLSYRIRSAKSSKVMVTFYSDFIYDHTVKIPKHTRVYTRDSINFLTSEDVYMEAGQYEVSVLCEQGTIYKKTYTGTGLSRFSNVDPPANVNQSITLTSENIDTDSIIIKDNFGKVWSPVDFIVFSSEIDRVYQIDLNPNNSVTIKFGDGVRGRIPQTTEIFTIEYRVSDAEKGRIGAGAIAYCEPIDDNGKYIEFIVSNKEDSFGGYSAQSSTSIRETAPGAIKAQDRAVTLTDFESLAKLVAGVKDARAYDINTNPDIPFHEVRVVVVPEYFNGSSSLLVDDVYNYLYKRMIPPTNLRVSLPSSKVIDIDLRIKKMADVDVNALEFEVRQVINSYFEEISTAIGEDFYPTDLTTRIVNIPNVKYVMSMTPSDVVTVDEMFRAELGNLTISIE